MLAVADRGGHAGIRHRYHDVDLDMAFARELRAESLSDLIHRSPADDGIRPREVDVFEDAGPRWHRRMRLLALGAVAVAHHDFTRIALADVFSGQSIQGPRPPPQAPAATEVAQHPRA